MMGVEGGGGGEEEYLGRKLGRAPRWRGTKPSSSSPFLATGFCVGTWKLEVGTGDSVLLLLSIICLRFCLFVCVCCWLC